MTRKEIFTEAHRIAKQQDILENNYRACFAKALKIVYRQARLAKEAEELNIADKTKTAFFQSDIDHETAKAVCVEGFWVPKSVIEIHPRSKAIYVSDWFYGKNEFFLSINFRRK